jgi:hypothetical protein
MLIEQHRFATVGCCGWGENSERYAAVERRLFIICSGHRCDIGLHIAFS